MTTHDDHELQHISSDGHRWGFYDTGTDGPPILVFAGGMGVRAPHVLVHQLGDDHRLISFADYGLGTRIDDIVAGAAAILDHLSLDSVHVNGASLGGILAQLFGRTHPERARSLILQNTALPSKSAVTFHRAVRRAIILMPAKPAQKLVTAQFRKMLTSGDIHPSIRPVVEREMPALLQQADKSILVNLFTITSDLHKRFRFAEGDPEHYGGPVLIMESDNDSGAPADVRGELRALYRRAQVENFGHAGHAVAMADPDRYVHVIRDFVANAQERGAA